MEEQRYLNRARAVLILFGLVLSGFFYVLYQLQVVNGEEYAARAAQKIARTETVEASRGQILDRYGRVLVYNELSYEVTLDTSLMGEDGERNKTLLDLLALCGEHGVAWETTFPVTEGLTCRTRLKDMREADRSRFQKLMDVMDWTDEEVADLLSVLEQGEEREEVSALGLLEEMGTTFGVDPSLPRGARRDLLAVLYELTLRKKDIARVEYIFAREVEIGFITAVKESALPGVLIRPTTVRRYATDYAAHLLGRVGSIPENVWETYKEQGYAMDETVGLEGAEAAFESYLRGTDGVRAVETNATGKVVNESWLLDGSGVEQSPQPGDNVYLTMDLRLQEAVEQTLAQRVPAIQTAQGASAVVIDVNSGGILASASYPTYSLSSYSQDFSTLMENPLRPMVNRAFQGIYAPGSTFKMVTAIGGLEEGIITPQTRIVDTGKYRYYKDYQPACWIYNQSGGTHGPQTVTQAITNSCNVFFYDVGRRLGIDRLGQYARLFGLGEPTGVELPEATGVVAGREYTQSVGQVWNEGSTLPAAIGQENNQFTPLQLANYIATLVNGGRHYEAHLLDQVKSADFRRVLHRAQPTLTDAIQISEENLEAVLKGMLILTQTGSLSRYFRELDVKVGAKTGSAQVTGSDTANGVFVAFAPYDDPQVALAIVVEKGGSGSQLAPIAADILTYYFHAEETLEAPPAEGTLIR